jgi:hypothetical protein
MTRPQLKDRTVVMGDEYPRFGVVPIHMISLPDNHCGMDMAQVEYYVALLRGGETLAPVLILQDSDRCWLIDGRHRFLAHIIAGRNSIGALVSHTIELI